MSQDSSHNFSYEVLVEITMTNFVTRNNCRQSIYFWKISLKVIIWTVFKEPSESLLLPTEAIKIPVCEGAGSWNTFPGWSASGSEALKSFSKHMQLCTEKCLIYTSLQFATLFLTYLFFNMECKGTSIYNLKQSITKNLLADCDLNLYFKKIINMLKTQQCVIILSSSL